MCSIACFCSQANISQSLRLNNSKIPRIKNTKFLGCDFYVNRNIQGNFQICISVPLRTFLKYGLIEVKKAPS